MPEAPLDLCTTCHIAAWDDRDIVAEQWITESDGLLVSLSTAQKVVVCYRPCSDRCMSQSSYCMHQQEPSLHS